MVKANLQKVQKWYNNYVDKSHDEMEFKGWNEIWLKLTFCGYPFLREPTILDFFNLHFNKTLG